MKKIIALILALLFCLPACAEITSEGSKIPSLLDDEVTAFAFHQKLDGFAEAEECIVRALRQGPLHRGAEGVGEGGG